MAALLMQAAMAVVSYHVVRGHSRRIQAVTDLPVVHDKDLPTLTVAVPARNETDALHACISSLLDSHYPKLEIIVLDDCSQTARTPEIIRDFAHKGVRFIRGTEPDGNWLAKNQAYAALVEASSGQLILFCGVDIRFTPDSLRRMVIYLLARRKTMLCVLPQNAQATSVPLIQPMRYLWELALPRRRLSRPPALSSCWLIARSALRQAGGFDAVARSVVPEAYFASRQTAGDGYSFMGGAGFGVSSAKSLREQRETAIRVTYPRLHKRPELVALVTALYVLWIGLPLSSLVYSLIFGQFGLLAMAALVGLIYSLLAYRLVLRLAYGYVSGRALLALPLAALVYIAILNYSMYKYEFSEVIWKGRNVCLPVMHVIPRLPKI
jgi:glycosyltransferase involved in cell wall biosynthesis